MATKLVFETIYMKRGQVTRRIQFLEDTLGFSVIEQERIIDRYKSIGYDEVWKTTFFLPATQRNIARSILVGRLSMAAYEEGNLE